MTTTTATRPNGEQVTVTMKPSAIAVLNVLRSHPDGACARTFADRDIYRFGARILELRRAGFVITNTGQCAVHLHDRHMPAYRVEGFTG